MPLQEIRRLVRHDGHLHVRGVRPRALSSVDLRRVGHHLRAHRGVAMFARAWLLVEGESEFWTLPQLAQVLGHDFAAEGVACVEYAQSGLEALLRTARELGIEWHVLADGDQAGRVYADTARRFLARGEARERITVLRERDIEHCLWQHGLADVLRDAAGLDSRAHGRMPARRVIQGAVRRQSKPGLALAVIDAIAHRGPACVPEPLREVIETCVRLARAAPSRVASARRPDAARRTRAPRVRR
jgi:putative ATP-dependent endonuclease of OLD family